MEKTNETGVYRKKDGRLWVRAAIRNPQGGTMERTRTMKAGQSMQEAVAVHTELLQELRQLRDSESSEEAPPTTIADYAEAWLIRKSRRRSPSTIEKYTIALSHHILPELGHIRLEQLTRDDVEHWVAWVERREVAEGTPYALETIRTWWAVLRNCLRDAFAEDLLPRDVTYRVTLPEPTMAHLERGPVRDRGALTLDELRRLLKAVRRYDEEQNTRWYPDALTMALTGMRASEAYALTWDSVDLDRNEIRVSARAWRGTVGRPKTGRVKTVPITEHHQEVLMDHRLWQLEQQHPGLSSGLVLPSDVGTPRNSSPVSKILKRCAATCGIEVDLATHTFRRTLRTILRRSGTHDHVVNAIIGQSTDEMAERYDRVSLVDKHEAVVHLNGLFA